MASSFPSRDDNSQRGDMINNAVKPGSPLFVQLKTSKSYKIRMAPEVDLANNRVLPMLAGQNAQGAQYNGVHFEDIHVMVGKGMQGRPYTGTVRCSDRMSGSDFDQPWKALYIRLKSNLNKNKFTPAEQMLIPKLLNKQGKDDAAISNPRQMVFFYGYILEVDGARVPLEKVRRQVICGTKALVDAMSATMSLAVQQGIDLQNPTTGHCINVLGRPEGHAGRKTASFDAEIDPAIDPLPAAVYPTPGTEYGLITSWPYECQSIEQMFVFYTAEEHIRRILSIYPEEVVAAAMASDIEPLLGRPARRYSEESVMASMRGHQPPQNFQSAPQGHSAGFAPHGAQPSFAGQQPFPGQGSFPAQGQPQQSFHPQGSFPAPGQPAAGFPVQGQPVQGGFPGAQVPPGFPAPGQIPAQVPAQGGFPAQSQPASFQPQQGQPVQSSFPGQAPVQSSFPGQVPAQVPPGFPAPGQIPAQAPVQGGFPVQGQPPQTIAAPGQFPVQQQVAAQSFHQTAAPNGVPMDPAAAAAAAAIEAQLRGSVAPSGMG